MDDRWTERLSEYLDGDLDARTRRDLEAHLESCADCREVLDDLRALTARAEALADREPGFDLWPGIARRLEPRPAGAWGRFTGWLAGARIALTLPQLAAAAALLVVVSGGTVWLLSRPAATTPGVALENPTTAERPADVVAGTVDSPAEDTSVEDVGVYVEPQPLGASAFRTAASGSNGTRLATHGVDRYDSAIAELETVLRDHRAQLDPATVAVLEQNLAIVDKAIADARRALAADPASAYLNGYLTQQLQRKVQVLRRAADIVSVHDPSQQG